MKITYNTEKLKRIINDLCSLTGLTMDVLDADFNLICASAGQNGEYCKYIQSTPGGKKKCEDCDKHMLLSARENMSTFSHICHAGLCDTCLPLLKNGIIAGYIIIGRVRKSPALDSETAKQLSSCGLDTKRLCAAYPAVTSLTDGQLASLISLLNESLIGETVEIAYDDFIKRAADYIDRNLSCTLSVEKICTELFVSKNRLYKSFRSFFGKTVNEYITSRRISRAAELLSLTDMSAYEVAAAVGIENYTYFSKVFKKTIGISPSEYRKLK